MLVFLMMDLHLIIVQAMVRSYSLLPPGGANMNNDLAREILNLSAGVFSIGFQIGAPLIIALFLSNMIIGLLARSVPQIQIFVVGFPLTLLLGFVFLMFGIPFLVKAFRRMFGMLDNQILDILRLLGLS
jgi:flagellar biosynthetic protein FliR